MPVRRETFCNNLQTLIGALLPSTALRLSPMILTVDTQQDQVSYSLVEVILSV